MRMKTREVLGYLGVLPFIVSLIYFDFEITTTGISGQNIFVFYSIAILSFLSGTIWQANNEKVNTALISNFFCLYAFFSIFLPLATSLLWLSSGYLLLWYSEYRLSQSLSIKRSQLYMRFRGRLTTLVITIHFIALLNVIPK